MKREIVVQFYWVKIVLITWGQGCLVDENNQTKIWEVAISLGLEDKFAVLCKSSICSTNVWLPILLQCLEHSQREIETS